jgi:O-antigen chain-terminating methyltransferase
VREVQTALQSLKQEQEVALQRLETEFAQREERNQGLAHEVREVQTALQSLKQEQGVALQRLEAELIHREEREKELEKALYQLKVSLVQQERRTTLLLEEARKRLPAPFDQQQLQTFLNEDQHRLDALYVSFEDQFRGTREDIKERLRVYLPLLKENGIGAEHMPILDLGCGRGEWLELLKEEGLPAQGVDINRVLIEQCRQQDYKVTESDALAYLRKLPDRSVGAVTGFHIIEHLSLQNLIQLLDETVRVLAPDGVAIFETPNPQNIMVGSCNFYLDPTHQRPLPSTTIRFLAEARGLCRVEVLNLHPYPTAYKVEGTELAERFNEFFYGPQDYAVVGWKV